jgi:hypothetical protein
MWDGDFAILIYDSVSMAYKILWKTSPPPFFRTCDTQASSSEDTRWAYRAMDKLLFPRYACTTSMSAKKFTAR